MTAEDKRGPGLKFPPPLLVLAIIAGAWGIDQIKPLPVVDNGTLWLGGAAIIGIALLIALIALAHFIEAKTKVEPWHPTTTVIQKGLYRYSRNPIYLSFCIATVGAGLALNSWWVIVSVSIVKPLLEHLVISKEEIYLEKKFGDLYLEYKSRVRRWI